MSRKNKPSTVDPFEQAFFDYMDGDHKAELIIHCNKGEPEIVPVHYFFRSYSEMPELEKKALAACSGKILDVGAGAGPHALYLQKRGYDVTALEVRPGFTEVLQRRGVRKVLLTNILNYADDAYDTLLMLMNGIGLAKNPEGLGRLLETAKDLLRPGGQIILDSTDLLYFYKQDKDAINIDLREAYYGEVEYSIEYNGLHGEAFTWLFIDYSLLSTYAEEAGYRCELMMETESFNYLARLYV